MAKNMADFVVWELLSGSKLCSGFGSIFVSSGAGHERGKANL